MHVTLKFIPALKKCGDFFDLQEVVIVKRILLLQFFLFRLVYFLVCCFHRLHRFTQII